MFSTEGADAIATITELREFTPSLLKHIEETGHDILIQRNGEPMAVLVSWKRFEVMREKSDHAKL